MVVFWKWIEQENEETGEKKQGKDRKAFTKIEPVGDNASGVADDDIPF